MKGVSKRGEAPLQKQFPLSFKGEGDTGGEVVREQILKTGMNEICGLR